MKRLLALCGMWPLVWTRDYDGEVRLSIARLSPFGEWTCKGVGYSLSPIVRLCPNGEVKSIYVVEWKEWKHNRVHVVFKDDCAQR